MMSPSFRFKGVFMSSFDINFTNFKLSRYANRSARFIDAYAQGATGPIAVWANRKYHGHRTLPPEVLSKLKNEFHVKYRRD